MTHTAIGYDSPADAMKAPRESIIYVAGLYEGTGVERPDFLAVIDVDPSSKTYSQITHRTEMPNVGDELHHCGWQICSSACHAENRERKHLVVPGLRSSRIHVIDVGTDPGAPKIVKVIEPEEVKTKTGLGRDDRDLSVIDMSRRHPSAEERACHGGSTGVKGALTRFPPRDQAS